MAGKRELRSRRRREAGQESRGRQLAVTMFVLCILLAVAFFVNRGIRIEGLYMDDLYNWSCYGEQSFWEFAFPIGTSSRFRPVYWSATYLEMMIVRNHVSWFVPINMILNAGVAFTLYAFAVRLSKNRVLSLFVGVLYLVSHFAYYQIAQALGLLETMALWEAILFLCLLYAYIKDGRARWMYLAQLVFFILAFTHERYVGLMPLFYVGLAFADRKKKAAKRTAPAASVYRKEARSVRQKQNKQAAQLSEQERRYDGVFGAEMQVQSGGHRVESVLRWLLPLVNFALIFWIRRLAIGTALPAGTGGTEVTDTFSLAQALRFAFDQLLYVFGVNIGPEYLSGRTWADCADWVHVLVYVSWIPLALMVISFLCASVRARLFQTRAWLGTNLLFLGFIALCIGCSSVTIRVEMRWVYVSYAAALLYLAYMAGVIAGGETAADLRERSAGLAAEGAQDNAAFANTFARTKKETKQAGLRAGVALLVLLYGACLFPVERYYRSYYPQIYFWENQDRMNSLAEQTVLKYGVDGVLGKQVYIVGNSYEMTDFYAETFFKVYDKEKTGQGTRIHFVDKASELPYNATIENSIVLKEVPEARGYQDVTEEVLGR